MPEIYPWNENVWQQTVSRLREGRLPHAMLFTGVRGLGKRDMAEVLAGLVLCHDSEGRSTPCGVCKTCMLLAAGTHSDLLIIEPEEAGKKIKIDQIREANVFNTMKPQFGRYKVIIIDQAHAMNANAANALLKTLEEPAGSALILLVTHDFARLLPTIKSRCQRLEFAVPDAKVAESWARTHDVEFEKVMLLHALSGGAPLRMLELQPLLSDRDNFLKGFLALLLGNFDPLKLASDFAKADGMQLLSWVIAVCEDMAKCKLGGENVALQNIDFLTEIQNGAQNHDIAHIFDRLDQAKLAIRQLNQQANLQLLLEKLFIDWANPQNKVRRYGTR